MEVAGPGDILRRLGGQVVVAPHNSVTVGVESPAMGSFWILRAHYTFVWQRLLWKAQKLHSYNITGPQVTQSLQTYGIMNGGPGHPSLAWKWESIEHNLVQLAAAAGPEFT